MTMQSPNQVPANQSAFSDELISKSKPPSQRFIRWLLREAPTGQEDFLHRLGFGPTDAAQGDHNHDGVTSRAIFDATTLPDTLPATATNAQIIDAINQLRNILASRSS